MKLNSISFPRKIQAESCPAPESVSFESFAGDRQGGAQLHRLRKSREGDGTRLSPGAVLEQLQSFVFAFAVAPLPSLAMPSAQLSK